MALSLEPLDRKAGGDRKCAFKKLQDKLDPQDQKVLQSWVDEKVAPYRIFMGLKADGHTIARQTVYEHAKGWCICGSK